MAKTFYTLADCDGDRVGDNRGRETQYADIALAIEAAEGRARDSEDEVYVMQAVKLVTIPKAPLAVLDLIG